MEIVERSHERVSAVDAKSKLPRLLQKVEAGKSTIIITRRGKPVARLIPYTADKKQPGKEDILKQFDEIRNSVKGKVDIKAYIAEGRNHSRKIYEMAQLYALTAYDAAYLELAARKNCNLASFDKDLFEAAQKAGVKTFQ